MELTLILMEVVNEGKKNISGGCGCESANHSLNSINEGISYPECGGGGHRMCIGIYNI